MKKRICFLFTGLTVAFSSVSAVTPVVAGNDNVSETYTETSVLLSENESMTSTQVTTTANNAAQATTAVQKVTQATTEAVKVTVTEAPTQATTAAPTTTETTTEATTAAPTTTETTTEATTAAPTTTETTTEATTVAPTTAETTTEATTAAPTTAETTTEATTTVPVTTTEVPTQTTTAASATTTTTEVSTETTTVISVSYIQDNYTYMRNFNPSLSVGKYIDLKTYFVGSESFSWYLEPNDYYTLTSDGILKMTKRGRAVIYAYDTAARQYYTFSAKPKSSADDEDTSTVHSTVTINIKTKQTKDLYSYVYNDVTPTAYTWTTDDDDVCEVSRKGVIEGIGTGDTYVRASYNDDDKNYSYRFHVYVENSSSYSKRSSTSTKSKTVSSNAEKETTSVDKTTSSTSKKNKVSSGLVIADGPQILGSGDASQTVDTSGNTAVDYKELALGKFVDISHRAWAHEAIGKMVDKEYIVGVSSTEFVPDNYCIRGDFSIVLAKMLSLEGSGDELYADVLASDYFASYVAAIKAAGADAGAVDGEFRPRDYITREEAFAMVYKALVSSGKEFNTDLSVLDGFADASEISNDDYKTAVAALLNSKLISGTNVGIEPNATITRAQMAVLLNNIYENM